MAAIGLAAQYANATQPTYWDRGGVDTAISSINGLYTPDEVNKLAQYFSNQAPNQANPVSFQELQQRLQGGAQAVPGTNAGSSASSGQYNNYVNQANQRISELDARRPQYEANIGEQYGTQKNSLDLGQQTGQENLNRSTQKVDYNQSKSLRDLATNIRGAFDASQNKLGNTGAGDSSAARGLGIAYGNLQSTNRGNIQQQTGQQYQDINLAGTQMNRSYQDKIAQLDQWKRDELFKIADNFTSQRAELVRARESAVGAQASAIDQMSNNLQATAAQQLQQLAAAHSQAVQAAQGIGQNDFANTNYDVQNVNQSNINPQAGFAIQSALNPNTGFQIGSRRRDSGLPY